MANWKYSIEPYKRAQDGFGFSPASEAEATMWFGFREKGDDRRCFGVFPSRKDAERGMEIMKTRDLNLKITRGRGR